MKKKHYKSTSFTVREKREADGNKFFNLFSFLFFPGKKQPVGKSKISKFNHRNVRLVGKAGVVICTLSVRERQEKREREKKSDSEQTGFLLIQHNSALCGCCCGCCCCCCCCSCFCMTICGMMGIKSQQFDL